MKKKHREAIEKSLLRNHDARVRRALIWQDHNERREGEIFLANLSQKEFDELPLTTKRLGGPGRTYQGELHQRGGQIYTQLWGDAECFGVFVQKSELKRRRIVYEFPSPE